MLNRHRIQITPLLIAIGGILPTIAAAQQWAGNPANGHWYLLTPAMSWEDAQEYAVSLGGHLVAINDSQEQNWLILSQSPGLDKGAR